MNIKAVVKVMNFHSLLRVESARKKADKYEAMETELASMIRIILQNENLRLDKKIQLPDPSLPELNIYLGSDYGFCGSVNSFVSKKLEETKPQTKIAVGKKLRHTEDTELFILQEEADQRFAEISGYLRRAVVKREWSRVNLIYNRYYDISSIKPEVHQIFPLANMQAEEKENRKWDDFMFEGNEVELLNDLFHRYLEYEVKIAMASAYASENIIRQNATTESLKKLDEMEEEQYRAERKVKTEQSFKKTVDSFVKQKSLQAVQNK